VEAPTLLPGLPFSPEEPGNPLSPCKDNKKRSRLAQLLPQTELLVGRILGTGSSVGLESQITYIFSIKTIQPDFS
jgi:hypothetical protein